MKTDMSAMDGVIPSIASWQPPERFGPAMTKNFYRHIDEFQSHRAQTLENMSSEIFPLPTGLDKRLAELEVGSAFSAATDFLANEQIHHAKTESFRALYLADRLNDIKLLTRCFYYVACVEEYEGNRIAVRAHYRAVRLGILIETVVKCNSPLLPTQSQIERYNSRCDRSFQQPHNDKMPSASPGVSSHLKRKREIHDVDSWYNNPPEGMAAMAAEAKTLDTSQPQAEQEMKICDSEHVESFQQPRHETMLSESPSLHQKRKREIQDEDPSKKVKTSQPQAEQQMRPHHDNIPSAFPASDADLKRKREIHDEDPSNTMTGKKVKASTFGLSLPYRPSRR